jgi:putative PIN family toxin of toxin-antitoxin system
MTRVVLDTNVLINADRGEGSHGKRLLELVRAGKIIAITSHPVRREHELLISRLVTDQRLRESLADFLAAAQEVEPAKVEVILDDAEDVKLLAAAVGGEAHFLVTSDRHLLDVGDYRGVRVVTPAQFWQWWQKREDEAGKTWGSWASSVLRR